MNQQVIVMARISAFWKPLIVCLVATPVALFVAIGSGGGGHGNYFWAKALFPYTMLSASALGSIATPLILLAIVQFPAYGIALGFANRRSKFAVMAIALSAAHLLAAVIVFLSRSENFG